MCVGAGGHAAVVIEAVQALDHLRVIGVVDNDSRLWGNQLSEIKDSYSIFANFGFDPSMN